MLDFIKYTHPTINTNQLKRTLSKTEDKNTGVIVVKKTFHLLNHFNLTKEKRSTSLYWIRMMSTENDIDYPEDDIGTNWCVMMIVKACNRLEHMQLSGRAPMVAQPAMYRQSKSNLYGFKWISYHSTLSFRS